MERFQERDGLRLVQGWGMTEMSPVGAVGHPPADARPGTPEEIDWRAKTGRAIPGVELRLVGDDGEEPGDGTAVGEIEVRGPWITASYWRIFAPEKFHDGWLRTGDVGTMTANGLLADHRPGQGRDQVGRRVDQLGRARERAHGPSRRHRGRRDRRSRPAMGRAAASPAS